MSSPSRFCYPLYFVTVAALLGSCSQQGPATTAPAPPAPATVPPAPQFPYGAKVDSLNGVAGHSFGQPLRAFPALEALPPTPGQLTRSYRPRAGAAGGWFGKHQREVPYQFYHFLDGRFWYFRAVGNAAALREEAAFLLGPGQGQGAQTFWEGQRARAVYSERPRGFEREGTLEILSKPLEAEQAARAQAKLKAENAQ